MRNRAAVLVLAPLILLAAGCDSKTGAGGSPAAPAVTMPSAPAATTASSPATSTPDPSTRCHTDELKVTSQAAPGGGVPMNDYIWLVFTNVSGRTCTLYGYPGVSWMTGASGQQVNDPAKRTDATPAPVALAPGGVAHAQVKHGKPQMYEPDCHAVQAAGFRVYPPDETAAVFAPYTGLACSAKGIDVDEVWPIVAGLSE